jgi:phage shock protein PspC (stress-responsive transcriptional regulator)
MSIFVILWLGLFNMNLATLKILSIALPLALFELLIAAYIVKWTMAPSINPDNA